MEGILLVDKPAEWTSFDVVNYVRKMVARVEGKKPKNVKVGHTGTLDPAATGLLVLLIGKNYTRRAGEFSKMDKTYEVEMTLGLTSSTGDSEGEKTKVSDEKPDKKDIEAALNRFLGEISQVPPAYSAIKVDGKRAYELARQGQKPDLKPRKVKIYDIKLVDFTYPLVKFTCDVSSGTYIRSLVEDAGNELGSGAYTSSLRRTRVGNFSVEGALGPTANNLLNSIFTAEK